MNPDRKPDLDLEVVLAAFKADEEDEATYQLLAATHDEDEDEAIDVAGGVGF